MDPAAEGNRDERWLPARRAVITGQHWNAQRHRLARVHGSASI